MLKTTFMGITQFSFAFGHIPEYFICGYYKMLWFEVFYKFPGWKTDCSRSIEWKEKNRPCDLYNGIYTIINIFICIFSIIFSIELACLKKTTNYHSRKNTLLVWVIIQAFFVLHLVLLHFLAIKSIQMEPNPKDVIVNSMILTTFTLSMFISFALFVAGLLQFIKLQIKGEFNIQDEIEKRVREHIERKSEKIRRIREAEIDPIKRLSLAIIENTIGHRELLANQ